MSHNDLASPNVFLKLLKFDQQDGIYRRYFNRYFKPVTCGIKQVQNSISKFRNSRTTLLMSDVS